MTGTPAKPRYAALHRNWTDDRGGWLHAGEEKAIRGLILRAEWLEAERQRLLAELKAKA